MKGNEFMKSLFGKLGLDNDELNAVASSGALQELEISDEVAESIEGIELFSVESAKNSGSVLH